MLPTVRAIFHYPTIASFRADTQAWLDVATGNYSTAERQALDALLGGFAADGILSFDRLYLLHFGDNAPDSLRCVVSRQNAASEGATPPTFVRRQGWQGNTTTGLINTNWAPLDGINFTQDNASMGCLVRRISTATTSLRFLMGCVNAGNVTNTSIGVATNNTTTLNRLNSNGTDSQVSSTVVPTDNSYCSISRASSAGITSRRGATELESTVSSAGRSSVTFLLLARSNNGALTGQGNHQLSMAHIGAAQSTAQNASFRSRMDTFNTAIGYVP